MSGRQNRAAAKTATTDMLKEPTGVKTRRSQLVLSDVSGNVPAAVRKSSRRKTAPVAEDERKTVYKRLSEKMKTVSPEKRVQKSAAVVGNVRKTSITNVVISNNASDKVQETQPQPKRGRKSATMAGDVDQIANPKPSDEQKTASPKKRGRKNAPVVENARETAITNVTINDDASDRVQTTQPQQKRGRKSAAMAGKMDQIANEKLFDERRAVLPKKRGRKSATVVNGQEVTNGHLSTAMTADEIEPIPPNRSKKPGPKNARVQNNQKTENENPAQVTTSTDMENELKQIIMRKYFHISERLQIDTSAKCLGNLIDCAKTHKIDRILLNDDSAHIDMYLSNNQPFVFLKWIDLHLLEGLMPKTIVMQLLFELILGINYQKDNEYDVEAVLEMAAQTFSNILNTFPPCWLTTLPEYRRLVSAPCKNRLYISQEFDTTKSLFDNITNNLESLIHPRNGTLTVEDQNKNLDDSLDISFSSWLRKNKQKFSYDELSRDEKVERTFYTLGMMVHLFEVDLQMWTARHFLNPHSAIFDQSKHPLINSVLWDNSEHNQINYMIKYILKLFVNYVSIDFPKEHTQILSRLANVVYNIFELNELTADGDDGEIEYPLANRNGNNFCDTLTTIIYENPKYSVNLWLKVVEYVIHPKLKLHLISSFFTRIQCREIILNPKKIYAQLRQLEASFDDRSQTDNNNAMPNVKRGKKVINQPHKYPFIEKVQRRATSEITFDQEVEMCLIALNSYVEVRHIKDVRRHLSNRVVETQITNDRQELSKLREDYDMEIPMKRAKTKTKTRSFSDRLKSTVKNDRIYDLNVTNAEAGLNVPLKIDSATYRDDIKFVDLVSPRVMQNLGAKFDHLFSTLN